MSLDSYVKELWAKQAITEGLYRYCRGLDRMDRAIALSIWHPDAIVDYGTTFKGTALAFIDRAWEIHETMQAHSHQITNILIEVSASVAVSEAYVTAALRRRDDAGELVEMTVRGRYLDKWSARNEVWAIDKRVFAHDFSDIRPITDAGVPGSAYRDTRDASYQFLHDGRPA